MFVFTVFYSVDNFLNFKKSLSIGKGPRGVMGKRVQTPIALLRSLLDKYPCERYEPPFIPQQWVK